MRKENKDTLVRMFNKYLAELSRLPKTEVRRFQIIKKKLTRLAERLRITITEENLRNGKVEPVHTPAVPTIIDPVVDTSKIHHNEKGI